MKLFVPFDFSSSGEMALHYAMYFQKINNSSISVLHVISPQIIMPSGLMVSPSTEQVKNLEIELRARAYRIAALYAVELQHVSTEVQLGSNIADQILEEGKKYDLIIMGTHDDENLIDKILGSVSNSILKYSSTPVLFTHSTSPLPHKLNKILFAIDDKTNIKEPLSLYSNFNKYFEAQTDFIHFRNMETDLDSQYDSILDKLYLEKNVNFAFNIETISANNPLDKITEVIEDRKYDLVVMVHSDDGILKSYFGKSFSTEAIHKTIIPALVYKSTKN